MFETVVELFREFNPSTIILIVLVTLILLGSIVVEYKDGRFRFSFRWTGLRRTQRNKSKSDKQEDIKFGNLIKLVLTAISGSTDKRE